MKKLLIAVAFAMSLAGCTTIEMGSTKITDPEVTAQLVQQKATKKTVYITLGQPHDVLYENQNTEGGLSQWIYYFIHTETSGVTLVPVVGLFAGGINSDTTKITYFFNKKNQVYKTKHDAFSGYLNQWQGMAQLGSAAEQDKKPQRVKKEMEKLGLPFDETKAAEVTGVELLTKEEMK